MTRRWCHCGAPLWREDHDKIELTVDSVDGCRLCGLDNWTSADVLDNAGPADEMVRRMHDRLAPTAAGADNSTDDTAATSRMLPVGCHYPYAVQRIEDDAETVGQWLSERYLIWPATFLWQA